MANNRPIASELQRIFVDKTESEFLEAIITIDNQKVIINNEDLKINSESEICKDEIGSSHYININHSKKYRNQIDTGMRLGSFLSECGWLDESKNIFGTTLELIQQLDSIHGILLLELNCLQKLLHVQALFCCYKEASVTSAQALSIIEQYSDFNEKDNGENTVTNYACAIQNGRTKKTNWQQLPKSLLASFYHEMSVLHFFRSEYDLSYKWSAKALQNLREDTPVT